MEVYKPFRDFKIQYNFSGHFVENLIKLLDHVTVIGTTEPRVHAVVQAVCMLRPIM